jgi:hypothetical protein
VGFHKGLVQVDQVADQVLAQRLQQPQPLVGGNKPVGRHNNVVLGGAGAQLGQQVVVGGVDIVVDPDICVGLKPEFRSL